MEKFKNFLFVPIALAAILLGSCGEDEPVPVIEEPDTVVMDNNPTASAFSFSMAGSFNGLTSSDIALGKCGVLYCLDTLNAQSIFNSWKEGNDDAECLVFDGGKANTKGFDVTVSNLYPDTTYSFCLFFKSKDNSKREISEVSTFRTLEFKPQYKSMRADTIRMCYAIVKGSVIIDSHDASQCSAGLILSDTVDGNLDSPEHIRIFNAAKGKTRNLRYIAEYLRAGREYYYRAFVKYTTPDQVEHVVYGPEYTFSTVSADDWGVDLGLPSGIKWSKCELGRQDFNDAYDILFTSAYYCRWGSLKSDIYEESAYEYFNPVDSSFVDIGDDIAGTQYDVAHYVLGGQWRMPTKEDVEELIAYCQFSRPSEARYSFIYQDYDATLITSVATITGPNKHSIKIRSSYFWTATMSDDGENPYIALYDYDDTSAYLILSNIASRLNSLPIRAVWDPKMK